LLAINVFCKINTNTKCRYLQKYHLVKIYQIFLHGEKQL